MQPALANNATKYLSTGACQSSQLGTHADSGNPSCSPPNNTRASRRQAFSTHTLQNHSQLSMTATTPAAPIACCKGPMLNVHKSCSQKAPRQTRSRDCWCSTGRVRERKSQRYNMHAAAPTTRATATQVPAKPCTHPVSRRHNQTAAGSFWRSQETALPSFWSCCLQPEVTVAQHEHSTSSAQAQHKLSISSARAQHKLDTGSA